MSIWLFNHLIGSDPSRVCGLVGCKDRALLHQNQDGVQNVLKRYLNFSRLAADQLVNI